MKKRIISVIVILAMAAMFIIPAMAAAPGGGKYYSFDGTLGGASVTGDRADNTGGNITFAEGKVGQAAVFDGKSGLSLGKDIIKGDTYSVAMWVKLDDVTHHTPTFFGVAPGDPIRWVSLVPLSWANVFGVWSDSGDGHWNDLFALRALPTDEWVHIAFTTEPAGDYNKINLFINGVEVLASASVRETMNNLFMDGGDFFIGVNFWDTPFKGMVDELYIYNGRVLSSSQVRNVMEADGSAPRTGVDDTILFLAVSLFLLAGCATILVVRKIKTH